MRKSKRNGGNLIRPHIAAGDGWSSDGVHVHADCCDFSSELLLSP